MQLKKILGLCCLLLSFFPAFSQYTISGNIQDKATQEPLPGILIYLSDLNRGTTSDIDGKYEIKNLKPGDYLVEVSGIGYRNISKHLVVRNDTIIDIELQPSVTELGGVVVTGVGRSTERKRSPIAVKALDENALKQNSATNLIDGLKSVPGVSQITTGAAISKPLIRGLGYNRVLTLNNGIRQEGQQWGDEHGIEIDEYAVDRVEIMKGPGSLMYGSDGIAGVINFLSPRPLPSGVIESQVVTNYQSNNDMLGYSLTNAGTKGDFQWQGRFSNKYANAYKNKYDGRVYNSGFREFNGNLFLGLSKDWGHTYLTLSSFNTDLGIVEGERDDSGRFIFENAEGEEVVAQKRDFKGYRIGFPYQRINHLSAASNTYIKFSKGSLRADLGFQSNSRKEFEDPTTPDQVDMALRLNTFTYNLRYNFEKKNGWETTAGVSGMQQGNTNLGEEFLIPDYDLFDIGGYLFTQKTFDKLTLAGGLRFDNRTLHTKALFLDEEEEPVSSSAEGATEKFAALRTHFNGFSGSIGLSYQLDDQSTLKLNLSRGYRAPNIAELSSNGKHEGTFRYELGNPNLKPESSNQIDFGYYMDSKHWTLEVTPFVNYIKNYVFIQRLSPEEEQELIPDLDDSVSGYEYASGDAVLYGGEVYLDLHPHPLDWLHFDHTFSFVNGTQRHQPKASKYLPSIPAPRYTTGLRAQFKEVNQLLSNLYVKVGMEYNFKQDRILEAFDTETPTAAYALWSLGLGTDVQVFHKKDFMSLYLNVENLTDKAYQNHLSRLKYAPENLVTGRMGVFNMGRNISIKMILNI